MEEKEFREKECSDKGGRSGLEGSGQTVGAVGRAGAVGEE